MKNEEFGMGNEGSEFCALSFRNSEFSLRPWNSSVWFNQINQTDQIDQTNQVDQSPQIQATTKQMMMARMGIEPSEMA
jgi:hypothetical protein